MDCPCLINHMKAKPPWTCPCDCHKKKEETERETIPNQFIIEALAFELGYKACEHGMNIIEARGRLEEIQQGTRKPINFFEGYRKEK